MERDPHIWKLVRESGLRSAPENFTASVMDKIQEVPVKKAYKPLIGRGGRILIILLIATVVVLAIFFTDPGEGWFGSTVKMPRVDRPEPLFHINMDFLKQINISTGVVSALVAMFILILSDTGMKWRRFSQ